MPGNIEVVKGFVARVDKCLSLIVAHDSLQAQTEDNVEISMKYCGESK
jgi:hypothetical protein